MSILTKRNNELEGAIEETSKSILELSDTLLQSTLLIQYPQAAQALRRVIENCLSPAQAGHLNSTAEGISEESSIYDRTQSNKLESSEQRGWWTGVFANVMLTETNNHSHPQSLVTDTSTSKHQLIQMPDTTKLTPYIGLSPVLSSNIFCYKGYSGFSKRLLQTCFLNGYQLLTDPFTNINKIIQVFGSQIGKIDQNRMTSFFRDALLEIGGNATEYQTPVSAVQDYEWNSYPKSLQDNYLYPREIPDKIQSSQELLNVYGVQDILLGRGIAIDSGTPTVQVWNATYSLIFDVKAFITCTFPILRNNMVLSLYSLIRCSYLCWNRALVPSLPR